ncbi:MAG: hypothetical protein HYY96_00835 [Candidatus Tectomicrobia bacterium]|nr:hypothetical protein [Candidatus Tectomicrobia bacterium]
MRDALSARRDSGAEAVAAPAASPRSLDRDLLGYVNQVAEQIITRVEHQRQILNTVLLEQTKRPEGVSSYCPLVSCGRRRLLEHVIEHAIEVLEETRKAFKSKQLETLRKELTGALQKSRTS